MREETKELKKMLFNEKKNGYDFFDEDELETCYDFCEGYKGFLAENKTERTVCIRACAGRKVCRI